MEHRSLPPRNKAVLRHRESTSEKGALPERTHTPITKSISKTGDKPHHEGNKLVRSKNLHHPRRNKIIPHQPHNSFTTNCVTPTINTISFRLPSKLCICGDMSKSSEQL